VDANGIVELLNKGGVIAILVIVIVALIKPYVVPIWMYRDMERDRDYWRDAATTGTNAADKATDLAVFERERRERGT
jgi:hypothetical protein